MIMTNKPTVSPLMDNNLSDAYLIYGIAGLLLFIALIGMIILIVTSCCWCFHSMPFWWCCCQQHRRSSYGLNGKCPSQDNTRKINFFKRYPSDITDFSQLYDSCPHLINNKATINPGSQGRNSEASCQTVNTLIGPITPSDSLHSFIETVPSVHGNMINRPFSCMKKLDNSTAITQQCKSRNPTNASTIVPLDVIQISSVVNDTKTNSPNTNIYETVVPSTPVIVPLHRATPIYETDWAHNLQKLFIKKSSSAKNNIISVIGPPSTILPTQPDLVPSIHYFQQKQHPYDRFLANRKITTDSMRRANMLRRIKDDAAFLY